jgi:uncharacterized membrane protein YkgB
MEQNSQTAVHQRMLAAVTAWMREHGPKTLRICVGLVYFWFGALKFNPTTASAEGYLPAETMEAVTFHLLPLEVGIKILAIWECFIGYCLIASVLVRPALMLLLAHLALMCLPTILFPDQIWHTFPYGLTLKGQYIVKNLVFIASALVLVAGIKRKPAAPTNNPLTRLVRGFDDRLVTFVGRHGLLCIRIGLGVVECFIGVGLLLGIFPRLILVLICTHLIGTFTPMFFYPDEIWTSFPFMLTLEGKYIVRNLVLYGAALMIGASLAAKRREASLEAPVAGTG